MKHIKTILLLAFISIFLSFNHPFHASITQCTYNPETKSLEISMRLFTDDLENAIGEELSPEPSSRTDSLIARYINSNFSYATTEKLDLHTIYLGRQIDFDLTYVFLEIPSFPLKDAYYVRQTVFFDRFDDQTNIVNVGIGEKSGSGYFTKGETIKTIRLQ